MYTPHLMGQEHSWSPPRQDLTPDDLAAAGWFIQPYLKEGQWAARHEHPSGGSEYSPSGSLDFVITYVRQVYIHKEPWITKQAPSP